MSERRDILVIEDELSVMQAVVMVCTAEGMSVSAASRAAEGLSELERVCFVLKHLEQWRLKEIAAELGAGVGTVKQALFRAVKKLRVRMTSLQGEL